MKGKGLLVTKIKGIVIFFLTRAVKFESEEEASK